MYLSFPTSCFTLNEEGLWRYTRPLPFRLLPAFRRNLLPPSLGYENNGLLQIVDEAKIPNPDMTFALSVLVWGTVSHMWFRRCVVCIAESIENRRNLVWKNPGCESSKTCYKLMTTECTLCPASRSFYFDVLSCVIQDNIWLRQIYSPTLICCRNFSTVCFAIVSSYLIWYTITAVVIIVTVLLLPPMLWYYCS